MLVLKGGGGGVHVISKDSPFHPNYFSVGSPLPSWLQLPVTKQMSKWSMEPQVLSMTWDPTGSSS